MPVLPSVSVTQAQADRIIAAFGDDQATAIIAYKDWLVKAIRTYVLAHTAHQLAENRAMAESIAYQAVLADLPPDPNPGGTA
jgi:hypothetical protein